MAVSINWAVLFVGVLMARAYYLGSISGPVMFGSFHVSLVILLFHSEYHDTYPGWRLLALRLEDPTVVLDPAGPTPCKTWQYQIMEAGRVAVEELKRSYSNKGV